MNKIWLIAKYEFTRHVFRWRFWIMLFLFPALGGFITFISFMIFLLQIDLKPIGYVDNASVIASPDMSENLLNMVLNISFVPYPDEPSARDALERKELQAYFALPKDYLQTREVRLVYYNQPSDLTLDIFEDLLRRNLLKDQPPAVTHRVINGSNIRLQATDEGKRSRSENQLLQSVIPLGIGVFLISSIFSCSGYLCQALSEEKENDILELLATSARPVEIMTGKIFGLLSIGLMELLVWSWLPIIAVFLLAVFLPALQGSINWIPVIAAMVTAPFSFLLIAALIVLLGVTILDGREEQIAMMLVSFPAWTPYLFLEVIHSDPAGPVATALSFFPLTTSVTLLLRMSCSEVPAWQILACTGTLILSTIGVFWLAGVAFRMWMLNGGKWIDLKALARKVFAMRFKKGAA